MTREEIEIQLWEYLDGTCGEADKNRLGQLISGNPVWKQYYIDISMLHTSISAGVVLDHPSLRFTKNVMDAAIKEQIALPAKKYINKTIVQGIAAILLIMIGSMFIYTLTTVTESNVTNNFLSYNINMGNILNSSFFIMIIPVNIVLALIFLESLLRRIKIKHKHS